jgi:adenine-specific DNA-methyltransferase
MTLDEYFTDALTANREKLDFVRKNDDGVVQYYVPPRSVKLVSDNWMDITLSGSSTDFDTEKHVEIVKRAIDWICRSDKHAVVLDAFAGSGTTAEAVMRSNEPDEGSRRFVIIECEEFIDSLTAARVRRVIEGDPKSDDAALRKGIGGTFSFVEVGNPMELEKLLKADKLPKYEDLAGYVFYTATGEDFDARHINRKTGFIGVSALYDVYLLYEPDMDYLKNTALTLDLARSLPKGSGKKRLVFAPTKYLDSIHLDENRIEFCQLPFEIYKAVKRKA